jgi:hypothetical protein
LFICLFVCLFLQKLADFFWVQRLIPREATPLAFMQATHAPPLASRNPAVVHAPNLKFFCWRSRHTARWPACHRRLRAEADVLQGSKRGKNPHSLPVRSIVRRGLAIDSSHGAHCEGCAEG